MEKGITQQLPTNALPGSNPTGPSRAPAEQSTCRSVSRKGLKWRCQARSYDKRLPAVEKVAGTNRRELGADRGGWQG